ncbi:MAG TPA: sterol desaturase family protein [Bacteriovoracaceae bacterium]|nr:sterol desaturase family protein [Bacteriovoracaceae bacterium]
MLNISDLSTFTLLFSGFLLLNFALFAFGGYYFFYRFLGPGIPHRKILEKDATASQMNKEKLRSLHTQVVFLILGVILYALYKLGLTRIYLQWDQRGAVYFILSYFIMHQLHDAYFYWTHRLMHQWEPIRKFHFVHHESSPPTPFSALSFHPVEALVQGFFWIVIALVLPISHWWMFSFYSFMLYINMWGHTSYEFWHRDLMTHPVLKILNTPTHHNLHHKFHNANYSIYYNFWDKVCGTNHPEYQIHYQQVKVRTEAGKTSRVMKKMKL